MATGDSGCEAIHSDCMGCGIEPRKVRYRRGPRHPQPIRKINQATGVAPFDLVWAATASDIEGPTDLDWVSLCFETEISRCALDSCMAQKRSNCLQIASAFQNVESLRPA